MRFIILRSRDLKTTSMFHIVFCTTRSSERNKSTREYLFVLVSTYSHKYSPAYGTLSYYAFINNSHENCIYILEFFYLLKSRFNRQPLNPWIFLLFDGSTRIMKWYCTLKTKINGGFFEVEIISSLILISSFTESSLETLHSKEFSLQVLWLFICTRTRSVKWITWLGFTYSVP